MKIDYSPWPRCDMCKSDSVYYYPPPNEKGYSGLCKECHHIFYLDNEHLFENQFNKVEEIK